MSARIFKLPITPAGRQLLRDCIPCLCNWCWPNGEQIDSYDFDAEAAEIDRLISSAPQIEAQA